MDNCSYCHSELDLNDYYVVEYKSVAGYYFLRLCPKCFVQFLDEKANCIEKAARQGEPAPIWDLKIDGPQIKRFAALYLAVLSKWRVFNGILR